LGVAELDRAPRASNVVIEAWVRPRAALGDGWCTAGVQLRESDQRFWQLNLVQAPSSENRRRFFELGQMLDGVWPSSVGWRTVEPTVLAEPWREGEPLRFHLGLAADRIVAEVTDSTGRLRFRCVGEITGPKAVRVGRPALHVSDCAADFDQVRVAWAHEAPEPAPVWPPYDAPAAAPEISRPARGVFQVWKSDDGRWWAVDPLGRGTVILGVDHVRYQGHWCEALGYAPYGRKNDGRYPSRAHWEHGTLARLRAWGFNALGPSETNLYRRGFAHSINLGLGEGFAQLGEAYHIAPAEGVPCTAFPNVYHPVFEDWARYQARRRCRPNRGDPWLLGYYLDNELAWWGRWIPGATRGVVNTAGLFDAAMRLPVDHSARRAAFEVVRACANHDLELANRMWGTRAASWEELERRMEWPSSTPEQLKIKAQFLRQTAERYFEILTRVVREVDPDHLILGARFAGTEGADPIVWAVAGRYCDVVSFNIYPMVDLDEGRVYTQLGPDGEPLEAHLSTYAAAVGRPLLITEWSFPALDSGLPCRHGAGQRFRTQAERTTASELFVRTVLSLPAVIGYNYFMWVDEPALGISAKFPEDSNYGLVNEDDQPYQLLVSMFTRVHAHAAQLRRSPPPTPRPRPPPKPVPTAAEFVARHATGSAPRLDLVPEGWCMQTRVLTLHARTNAPGGISIALVTEREPSPLGTIRALLEWVDAQGRSRWSDADRVVAWSDMSERGHTAVQTILRSSGSAPSFECELVVRAATASAWFTCELVAIRNLGGEALCVRSVFFPLHPAFDGRSTERVPNLWKALEADAWIEPNGRARFLGAVAPRTPEARVLFWVDHSTGHRHADAQWRWPSPVELAAGERRIFQPRPWILVLGGIGGRSAWDAARDTLATE
jgi:hypothetical protein